MYRVFIGYEPRQPIGYAVTAHSVQRNSSKPVACIPLILSQLPITRRGVTEFTFSRWLVPWLCDYQGHAVFMDSDVAVTGDIVELFESCEGWDGREVFVNQKQPEFEWPSVMVFNNALCKVLTPEFVQDESNACYGFQWAKSVGHFPEEWNHCVNVEAPNIDAKLYHYTQGIPYWPEVRGAQEDTFWWQEWELVKQSAPWLDIHGNSVHFKPVIRRMMARYGLDARVN